MNAMNAGSVRTDVAEGADGKKYQRGEKYEKGLRHDDE